MLRKRTTKIKEAGLFTRMQEMPIDLNTEQFKY